MTNITLGAFNIKYNLVPSDSHTFSHTGLPVATVAIQSDHDLLNLMQTSPATTNITHFASCRDTRHECNEHQDAAALRDMYVCECNARRPGMCTQSTTWTMQERDELGVHSGTHCHWALATCTTEPQLYTEFQHCMQRKYITRNTASKKQK